MKKVTAFLITIILISCGSTSNSNDLMTKLINEKKNLQDSIDYSRFHETEYQNKAKDAMSNPDSTIWKRLADSSTQFYMIGSRAKERIAEIDFSVDSLSKMK